MKLPDVSLEHIFLAAMERGKKEKRFWGIIDGLYILLTFSLRAYIIPVSLSFHRHPTPLSGRSLLEWALEFVQGVTDLSNIIGSRIV